MPSGILATEGATAARPNALAEAYRAGKLGEAIDRIGDAVSLAPGVALFRVNLGEMSRAAGRTDEAIAQPRRAL